MPKFSLARSDPGLHNAANAPYFAEIAQNLPCDWVFSVSDVPVLIVDARSARIVEGNPAAAGLFRTTRSSLLGSFFLDAFDLLSAQRLRDSLATVRNGGTVQAIALRTHNGANVRVGLSLFRIISSSYFLVHPTMQATDESRGTLFASRSSIFQAVDEAPLGFVVTDSFLRIEYANRAFVTMAASRAQRDLIGEPLAQWLTLSPAHVANLEGQVARRQAVGQLTTTLLCEHHSSRAVEVSTVSFPDGDSTGWGFCVEEIGRLN